jgi:Uma2 family endonuclease
LVIEVAVSSLPYDLTTKAAVYAAAGVPDFWVVDLVGRRVVVHRSPSADGYRERFDAAPGDELRAIAVELPALPIAELLRAAGA